jgi:formate/nitrite transporter FocA (FNT family)
VTQKIFGLLLPVAAFVAAGFEHSIVNTCSPPRSWSKTCSILRQR